MFFDDSIFVRKNDVIIYDLDEDGMMIYDSESQDTHVLNEMGSFIWKTLETTNLYNDIVAKILSNFDEVGEEQINEDLSCFLEELIEKGLVLTQE